MNTGDLLTLLLGGGFVATLTAAFQGVRSLQTGARTREKETVSALVNQRNEAWVDRDNQTDAKDYWRNWAGTVEYLAGQGGVVLPPRPPEPIPKKFEEPTND